MVDPVELFKNYLITNHLISAILVASFVMLMINIIIPRVVGVALKKRLINPIISRSSHMKSVPSLGGVGFFMVYLVTIPMINMIHNESFAGYNIIAAITILFMVGLKDDLVNSSAKVKLYGQFLASFFIVLSPEFIITNYHGFFGIHQISPFISMLLSLIFLIFLINAFNLIDGLDGLASVIGIVISSAFMFMYTIKEEYFYSSLSLVTIAMLVAFLKFNLSNGRFKTFMGDCGSLIVGLMIGVLSLHYLATDPLPANTRMFYAENRFIFIFSVLFIPLLDAIRVIVIRIAAGKSPMQADRNHLHHILLDYLKSHIGASVVLGLINVMAIIFFGVISNRFPLEIVSLSMILFTAVVILFFYVLRKTNHKRNCSIASQRKSHVKHI